MQKNNKHQKAKTKTKQNNIVGDNYVSGQEIDTLGKWASNNIFFMI